MVPKIYLSALGCLAVELSEGTFIENLQEKQGKIKFVPVGQCSNYLVYVSWLALGLGDELDAELPLKLNLRCGITSWS